MQCTDSKSSVSKSRDRDSKAHLIKREGNKVKEVVIRNAGDVLKFVNQHTSQKGLLITLIAFGGVFVDGYDFTSLSIGAVQLKAQFGLSAFQLGTITASMAVGALLAALVGGYFVDKIGRYKMFLLDLFLFVASAIGAAFSPNIIWLLFFRFFMGVGVGLDFPAAMSFVAEFSERRDRSQKVNFWGAVWSTAVIIGLLWVLGLYYLVPSGVLWRWAVGMGALPAFIVVLLRYRYMMESPTWMARSGDLSGAARVLSDTYGVKAMARPDGRTPGHAFSVREIGRIFRKPYAKRTLLASVLAAEGSIEFFGISFYFPVISLIIFGKVFLFAILGTIGFNIFGLVGGIFGALWTPKQGMRRLAAASCIGVIVSLVVIGIFRHSMPVYLTAAILGIFDLIHGFGPAIQGMGMASLSYPTEIRGIGIGWTQSAVRIGSIIGFYVFPLLMAVIGLSGTLLVIAIAPLITLTVILFDRWDPALQRETVDAEELADLAIE